MSLYTKQGRPLQVSGDIVYSRSGRVVGRISSGKVYGLNDRYVGSIDGDRLVYRSTESGRLGSSLSGSNIVGSAMGSVVGSAIWVTSLTFAIDSSQRSALGGTRRSQHQGHRSLRPRLTPID